MDPDLEGSGEAAGGGVGRGDRGGGPEVTAYPRHTSYGGRGGGGGLQSSNLQIVPIRHLAALGGAEGGHPSAHRAH